MINLKTQLNAIRETAIEYIQAFVGDKKFELELDEYIHYQSIDEQASEYIYAIDKDKIYIEVDTADGRGWVYLKHLDTELLVEIVEELEGIYVGGINVASN